MSNIEVTVDEHSIVVVNETYTIDVDPVSQEVTIVSSGPIGPPGWLKIKKECHGHHYYCHKHG